MHKIFITLLGLFFATSVIAQTSEISFPVSGNCDMCKKRIENAVDVKGVKTAVWDMQTKMLTVKFQPSKIKEEEIKQRVAKAGYDTPGFSADEADYNKLPECCRYRGGHHGHDHPHPHH
jgi:periplasmic mercuric ion binding protein